jgi:hypothetical protein
MVTMRPLRNKITLADKLAAKKRADAYVGRDGSLPSILAAAKEGARQDLNDDDRKHLKFCLAALRKDISFDERLEACLEFVEAILNRDYQLDRGAERKEDQNNLVDWRADPDLYAHMMAKRTPS